MVDRLILQQRRDHRHSTLRVRIRITFANGGTALRWVKPVYLRRATPERYGEPYPE
jgi:hypothetical protein